MSANEFINLLSQALNNKKNNKAFHKAGVKGLAIVRSQVEEKETAQNQGVNGSIKKKIRDEVIFIEDQEQYKDTKSNTSHLCLGEEIRIKNNHNHSIACLKFTSNKDDNYPSYFNKNFGGLCCVPEGILFVPIIHSEYNEILCISIEMKSENLGGSIQQVYAGKIISEYIIQAVLNSGKDTINSSGINFHYIGIRFSPTSNYEQQGNEVVENVAPNRKSLRFPTKTGVTSTQSSGKQWYQFNLYKDSGFHFNEIPHPCYYARDPKKMFINELVKNFYEYLAMNSAK